MPCPTGAAKGLLARRREVRNRREIQEVVRLARVEQPFRPNLVPFVRGDAEEGKDYDKDELIWLWHHTTQEDEYIIMRNSAGVNSRFFEPGPYNPGFEYSSLDFVNWYLDILAQSG